MPHIPIHLRILKKNTQTLSGINLYQKIANKSSIPEQRNCGVKKAEGDIIVFIDANCIPVGGWLTKLTAPILSGEEQITAGPFGSVNISSRIVSTKENLHEYLTCSGTGNLAFRKSVWEKVGGFDENFCMALMLILHGDVLMPIIEFGQYLMLPSVMIGALKLKILSALSNMARREQIY